MSERSDRTVAPESVDFRPFVDTESITVLHVDDEPGFVELVAEFLTRANADFEIITETRPSAVLERLDDGTNAIDCVVSDHDMPGMTGIELLEAVRSRWPDLPFILFTGEGSETVASDAISAGVTDYLQKEGGTDQYAVLANRIENSVEKTHVERNCEQLLSAIETAREGISFLDENGEFVYVNQAYAETYGYEREELLGEHWKRLYPPEDVGEVREKLPPNLPENEVRRERTRMVRADGSEIVVDHALSYTPDGLMVCAVNVIGPDFDQQGLLTDVFDALDDLLFFFDEDGTLELWNERVEAVTGYDGADLSAQTPSDLVHEDDRERMDEHVWDTHKSGETRVEVQLRTDGGETAPYEFISKPVANTHGDVIGRIGLGRNVSERKRYQRQIERQNERLEHFAEVLSHDLRNPLAVADGYLDAYRETDDDEHYETTKTALNRMDTLITDILELAQTGTLIDMSDYESVELDMVAANAWTMIRRNGATLDIESSELIEADASRLQQLLENLFRNSVEHGGTDISVRTGVLSDREGFYVEDDGPGILEREREVVFEAGHSTKSDGTGFGLATVKQLVDAHDWTIRITESGSGGARFEVRGVELAGE